MSPTLLGGSASTASTGSSTGGVSARNDAATGTRRDFDAMLKADSGGKPATRASAEGGRVKPKSADTPKGQGSESSKDPAASSKADAGKDAGATRAGESEAAGEADTSTDQAATDATATDSAPWPPLGLAGLALTGLAPPPVDPKAIAALPTASADPAQPLGTDALLAQASAAPATSGPVPATAAPAASASTQANGPIALPLDGDVTEDLALPKALADAIAAGSSDADAPTTPFLHALQTAADLKTGASPAPFSGSPTATPHVGGEDFEDAMSARIGWLADQKIGHATIKVTPHDLGLIEVRLQMDGDKVHASFTSAHADVRHALESSLPRLREMLNDQGFQLGNADVGHQHTAQDGRAGSGGGERGGFGGDGDPGLVETTVSPSQLMRQRGLLDAYA